MLVVAVRSTTDQTGAVGCRYLPPYLFLAPPYFYGVQGKPRPRPDEDDVSISSLPQLMYINGSDFLQSSSGGGIRRPKFSAVPQRWPQPQHIGARRPRPSSLATDHRLSRPRLSATDQSLWVYKTGAGTGTGEPASMNHCGCSGWRLKEIPDRYVPKRRRRRRRFLQVVLSYSFTFGAQWRGGEDEVWLCGGRT